MTAIHVPANKGTVYTPVMKTCRVATDRGMIRTPKQWVRINDLSSLYPEGQFRAVALDAAKRFGADKTWLDDVVVNELDKTDMPASFFYDHAAKPQ